MSGNGRQRRQAAALAAMLAGGWLMTAAADRAQGQNQTRADEKPLTTAVLFRQSRIPKIVVATDGTVLAFAKGCRLLRRSGDGGDTWSDVETLPGGVSGSAIVDEETGDILVVCPAENALLRSRDHGTTWVQETIVVKPNAMGHGVAGACPADTVASESGITLRHGKHPGRLLMPARIQPPKGNNDQEWWPFNYNTSVYSDDRGRTWQVGYPVQSGTGEGTLAELNDGRIYYNSRCHMAVDHKRRIAWSHDGGHMWTDWETSRDLFEVGEPFYFKYGSKPSYGCNAGLVRIPPEAVDGRDVLVFSTPDNPGKGRTRMSVWASVDGAVSWPHKRLVHTGHSAYSSLAAGPDGTVYLLFESGEKKLYDVTVLARFPITWLLDAPGDE